MSKETTGPELPDVIYHDCLVNKFCLNKSDYSMPNRYVEIYPRPGHEYAEQWKVFSMKTGEEAGLNIAFDESIYENLEATNTIRNLNFKKYVCLPLSMIRVGVPEAVFKKYWEEITG
jgi:hypothetical protein